MTADLGVTAPTPADQVPALSVSHMDVTYRVRGQDRLALRDVSFQISRGESYGLVGESGSGKSTAALALVRYLPSNGRVSAGTITIDGLDPLSMGASALRDLRARTVSMVYQEPGRALNPSMRVGRQIAEVFEIAGQSSGDALQSAEQMLRRVQISDPGRVMQRYPHELSGGMAQRAVIAMALARSPSLLILDEPTTALDATVEAEVLDLVAALREEFDTSVLFISHNLAVIAKMCDRVGVLYAGELVEEGPARAVFENPSHPYTVGLLRCIPRRGQRKDSARLDSIPGFLPTPGATVTGCIFAPRCGLARDRCREEHPPFFDVDEVRTSRCFFYEQAPDLPRATPASVAAPTDNGTGGTGEPLVVVERLSKTFAGEVQALAGVDLSIQQGETLGLVRYLSDRIVVLYLGRVMEVGPSETVFDGPHHPYTEALFSAVPSLDGERPDRIKLTGEIPSAADPPSGCVFHTRCPRRLPTGICESTEPALLEEEPGHQIRCHIPLADLRELQRSQSVPPREVPSDQEDRPPSARTSTSGPG